MRENAARALKFRGQALTAMGKFDAAENELRLALNETNEIKSVRLQWDTYAALEKLYRAWGKNREADEHKTNVISIVKNIRGNLQDDELKAGLPDFQT